MIITASEHISEVSEHFKDFSIHLIIMSEKKLCVRFSQDYNMPKIFKKLKLEFDNIETCGCHKLAGGINLKENSSDDIMNMIEFIYEEVINE